MIDLKVTYLVNIMIDTGKKTFILIDGSYYCFYRYYSIINWFKNANKEETLENPIENEIFVAKFKKTFIENIKQLPKRLNIIDQNPIIIVGKDCKRSDIWRNKLLSSYKSNRNNDNFKGGPLFKMAYDEKLFEEGGAQEILDHPTLEADDCIAIYTKKLQSEYPECKIYIITSDKDYLQLSSDNIYIYNLSFVKISDLKSSVGIASSDLAIKTIMGDVSDNIPSAFPRCGLKTALKCINDESFFKKKMNNNEEYYKQYELNKILIDFKNIPNDITNEYLVKVNKSIKRWGDHLE